MSTNIYSAPPTHPLPEAAREIASRAADAGKETAREAAEAAEDFTDDVEDVAGEVSDATKGMARRVSDSAKDMYHSAAQKAGDAVSTSKDYVRRNPVPVVLGAVAFGAAIGLVLLMTRRRRTFGERYVGDPLVAMREALAGALAPFAQRIHERYDSARNGAGKAMERMHDFVPERSGCSVSEKIGRLGKTLRFW